ncbi:hypothetical protein M2451_002559 [Dysgonomonas sp. PFB1-18]|uniref:hypothetical protein n=1 Tax=unclassified Dysgonomonas TaxID=2630389 RepID=UPI002473B230|nr:MULTISPECIES: hypothetical protein [unclassified Dysgonomonas]MDH6308040.1 hypothetical protein [Dysgonomonas sp. PF1-14]MDH6339579.1 hypothetical protein [Dysgonomonas sp. PF1-16]MDH6381230.1 hypothetical protein [Dysgonomonas sp. PFB1-18]MDH6398442.1 hypothetical protein [Dysgonomonas sp. PF1-23]
MPVLSTMGLKKIWITPSTGSETMPANGAAWTDLGDVYKDTCTLKDSDGTETKHESETSSKKIVMYEPGETSVELTLMDPDLELLVKYFGGEIQGTGKKRTWKRPRVLPYSEWAVWQQPEEGFLVGCPNARIIPKFEITYSAKGICLVPMTIKYQAETHFNEENKAPTTA